MNQLVKKIQYIFGLLLLLNCIVFTQAIQAQEVSYTLLRSSSSEAVVRVDFPNYQTVSVNVNGVTMSRLQMGNAFPVLSAGAPEMLESAISLIVPENSRPTAEIIDADYQTIDNFNLAPSKGKLYRNIDPNTVPYQKNSLYTQNRYLYNDSIEIGNPYQLRDYNGIAVKFFPFAYNPVQKSLKAYKSITAVIHFNSNRTIKQLSKVSKTFDIIYSDHFLNYKQVKANPLVEAGNILILAPANFCEAMQPYADWKIKNGYPTEIVSLATVGNTSTAVKNYISSYYTNHGLTFVIIVGDNGQFPVISAGGNVSDNYYTEILGSDNYPDLILGKISAETVAQVNTQVTRFIQYEENPGAGTHFPVFCGIGSDQGPGDNNEYDYQHIRNIDNVLTGYTYTSGFEFFEGNQGGLDASGSPTASQIGAAVNSGVGVIDYCGHGADTYWVTSDFSVSNIGNLTNTGKLPFIFSVACVNGNYSGQTCFAEAWLRATYNNQPAGAVTVLMSTINQPWNSPMCAQDEMIKYLTGNSSYDIKRTFGGIVFNGFIKMLDNYNDYEVTRTWLIFGDPTLYVRTAVPQALTVNYSSQLPMGSPSLTVTSPVEGAKITLSTSGHVLSTGVIANGTVTLAIPDTITPLDTIFLLATATNYIPVEGTVTVFPNNGPYVICNSYTLHDNGNQDNLPDYGETIRMDATMTNVGLQTASNVNAYLRTSDPYITLVDSTLQITSLSSSASDTYANAFTIRVANNVPAYHTAAMTLHLVYNNNTYNLNQATVLHAPQLVIGDATINDATLGNNNHKLDLSETADVLIPLQNTGNGNAQTGMVTITNPDGKLILYLQGNAVPALTQQSTQTTSFRVQASAAVTSPTQAILHVVYQADSYTATKDIPITIGVVEEDWESAGFTAFSWVNNSSKPWTITTQNPYDGQYAVKSGAISSNGNSSLSISMTNASADSLTFYYKVSSEQDYDFLKFYIDGTEKDSWSGEIGWSRAAYLIPAGQHTFKWTYSKDYYGDSGSDMAMLDDISFPCMDASGVGIEDVNNGNITIKPNPATNYVQLSVDASINLQNAYYQLFDLSGRLLSQEAVQSTTTTIALQNYAKGLYILKLWNDGSLVKASKIIKQ